MRLLRTLGLSTVSLLAAPSMARASGGLPQFDVAYFPEQLFWLAISFGLLYALMSFVALPRVAHTQRNRKHIITAEIKTAHAANDDAKRALDRVEKTLKDARADAQAKMVEMIAEVTEATASRKMAQENELQRKLHSTEEKIVVAREAALRSLGQSVGELAAAVTEKTIGAKMRMGV